MDPHESDEHAQRRGSPRRFRWGSRRREQLDDIERLLHRIDAALVVRDPGTARSAEAYDGLRKQVIAAATDRRRYVVQLTEFAEAARRGDDLEALRSRVAEWLQQGGVAVVDDPSHHELFEVVGDGQGVLQVLLPAYVDVATSSLVRRGVAEWVVGPTPEDQPPNQPTEPSASSAEQEG